MQDLDVNLKVMENTCQKSSGCAAVRIQGNPEGARHGRKKIDASKLATSEPMLPGQAEDVGRSRHGQLNHMNHMELFSFFSERGGKFQAAEPCLSW